MQKHFNTDFSVKTPDTLPTLSTGGIEQYYPYTLESAGIADFYPSWSSAPSSKRKKMTSKVEVLEENLEQLKDGAEELSPAQESAA